jgi:hypothetical protein
VALRPMRRLLAGVLECLRRSRDGA